MMSKRREHGRRRGAAGFTLIELMAGVAIMGIMLSIAIPGIYRSMKTLDSRQDADALAGRLRLARSQALSNFSDIVIYFGIDGVRTYTVHVDNGGGTGLPDDPDFDLANKNNGNIDDNEIVMDTVALKEGTVFGYIPGAKKSDGAFLTEAISFDGDPARLTFRSDGTADANGWVSLMPLEDFLNQDPGRDWLIEVASSTGEIQVLKATY